MQVKYGECPWFADTIHQIEIVQMDLCYTFCAGYPEPSATIRVSPHFLKETYHERLFPRFRSHQDAAGIVCLAHENSLIFYLSSNKSSCLNLNSSDLNGRG